MGRDHVTEQQRAGTDRRADRRSRADCDEHAPEAAEAGERIAAMREPAQQRSRDEDLEHVAARLAGRRPQRERVIVVREEVSYQHPRPVAEPAEVKKRDPHPHRQPYDRGNRTGELQRIADLRHPAIENGECGDAQGVASAWICEQIRRLRAPRMRPFHSDTGGEPDVGHAPSIADRGRRLDMIGCRHHRA
jgi:hypothetical protein